MKTTLFLILGAITAIILPALFGHSLPLLIMAVAITIGAGFELAIRAVLAVSRRSSNKADGLTSSEGIFES